MNPAGLVAVLLLPDGQVAGVAPLPEGIPWRLARWGQWRAYQAGLAGSCEVTLTLLPRRGAPELAGALELVLRPDGTPGPAAFVVELPLSVLEPVISSLAERTAAAQGWPASTVMSYIVPRQQAGPQWAGLLPAFATRPVSAAPATETLYLNYASAGDAPVCLPQAVLTEAAAWCCGGEAERGGVLLGHLCYAACVQAAGPWVEIVAFAPALDAQATVTNLTFNLAAWQNIEHCRVAAERKLALGVPLQIVGWAHSHPRLPAAGDNPFFLSSHDAAIMAHHFPEPWCCALVFDGAAPDATPLAECLAVFGWDHGVNLVPRSLNLLASGRVPDAGCQPSVIQLLEEPV